MKTIKDTLKPGDTVEIDSKVYNVVSAVNVLSCKGCAFRDLNCWQIKCSQHNVILIKQSTV